MSLLLACSDRYALLAEFDPESRALRFRRRNRKPNGHWDIDDLNGWFAMMEGHFMAVYAHAGELHLLVNEEVFTLDAGVTAEWSPGPPYNRFVLRRDGAIAYECEYLRPAIHPGDIFDRIEEDCDFFLYVRNLLSNPKRREHCMREWGAKSG